MIVKILPMNKEQLSSFTKLVKYLTDPQQNQERVGLINITNCHLDNVEGSVLEIEAVQAQNQRALGDKTFHLMISFRAGEQPAENTIKEIEAKICAELGFAKHQRISVIHHDTDNLHIHLAINKIHPEKLTLHEPYLAFRTLAEICPVLERQYGLQADNHEGRKSLSQNRSDDMERHSGIESLMSWVRRTCREEMKNVQSWEQMHKVMAEHGLSLQKKGNGLVINSHNNLFVKASSVDRGFSKVELEKRLGIFEPAINEYAVKTSYSSNPKGFSLDTENLFKAYGIQQENAGLHRKESIEKLKTSHMDSVNHLKQKWKMKKAAIRLIKGTSLSKRILYDKAFNSYKKQMQEVKGEYAKQRQRLIEETYRLTWADWLRNQAERGNETALKILRSRDGRGSLKGNTLYPEKEENNQGVHISSQMVATKVTKKGTSTFFVGESSIREDGESLKLSRNASNECLKEALILAIQKYGKHIKVNGSNVFKKKMVEVAATSGLSVIFSDKQLEQERKLIILSREKENEESNRRTDRRSNEASRPARRTRGNTTSFKPNIAKVGKAPPPTNRNRLRNLSELGVVQLDNGSQMLLQGNVSHNMEFKGTERVNALRWDINRAGGLESAQKYVAEREQKRLDGFDIMKHVLFVYEKNIEYKYAGVRTVNGDHMVLLMQNDIVSVLPVDEEMIAQLKKNKIGKVVEVTAAGKVRGKGRKR